MATPLTEDTLTQCCKYFLKEHKVILDVETLQRLCSRFGLTSIEAIAQEVDFLLTQPELTAVKANDDPVIDSQSLLDILQKQLQHAAQQDAEQMVTILKKHPATVAKYAMDYLESQKEGVTIKSFKSKLTKGLTIGEYLNYNRQYSTFVVCGLGAFLLLLSLIITLGIERYENNRLIREYVETVKNENHNQ
jgi:hypothetical protein